MKKIISIIAFISLGLTIFAQDYKLLNINEYNQEFSLWCWASCSQMILSYYNQSLSQCEIAEIARQIDSARFAPRMPGHLGSIPCCQTNNYDTPGLCNRTLLLDDCSGCEMDWGRSGIKTILSHFNIGSTVFSSWLSYTDIQNELNNRHPFIIRWYLGDYDAGHFIICKGYDKRSGTNYIYTYDPFGTYKPYPDYPCGYRISSYDWVVSGSSPNHSWTHSLTLSSNPPCGKSESSFTSSIQSNITYNETELVTIHSSIINNSNVVISFGKECILDTGFEVTLGSSITIQPNSSLICN